MTVARLGVMPQRRRRVDSGYILEMLLKGLLNGLDIRKDQSSLDPLVRG